MRSSLSRKFVFVWSVGLLFGPSPLRGQVAGQNVNMVSGTQWPGGDPFLQRQNEPSIAVSSRNPRHLLAGANDYRAVDIPFSTPNAPETGDAWLGVFKSFDGGITWKSTLLPGYPQQNPRTGPLATFSTAADPVVRAGTNGLFYYAGIAFNRDTKNGVVFVSRFMDLNNKENGDPTLDQDPIRFIDTKIVDSGNGTPFIDKPWIAVDKPRLLDGVCRLTVPQPKPGNPNATVQQTVPAGAVYAAWTEATGSGSGLTTNLYFSSSSDCAASWSTPVKINDTNKVNQGASIAIDPATGVIYVVWRRFASGSQTDAILVSRSLRGRVFTKPSVVVSLPAYTAANPTGPSFFDQGTTTDSFRTNAYPTVAIDRRPDSGDDDDDQPDDPLHRGRVYVAWSQRGVAPSGDARIVLSVSTDGGQSWSTRAPVDNSSLADDSGHQFSRGHQFMPQMTSTADRITVIYYDARLDHSFGLFSPRSSPLVPDPITGKLYLETWELRGELLDAGGTARVFTPFLVETGMSEWRHTLDLRVAQANAAPAPAFTSSRLSQYIFGTRGDETGTISVLQQLQVNPPNLKLFQQGSVPFLGDYIDVAGPMFLPPAAPGRRWRFNSKPNLSTVVVASWTSNQDVRPPLDGNWANYTPVASTGGFSIFNPGIQKPPCVSGQDGMRNQNIYAARISQGLAVSSVQNAKPLSSTLQRALSLNVENLTPLKRTFRMTIAGQPAGGRASFVPAPNPLPNPLPAATTTLDVVVPANSSVARSVYALSTDPHAMIEVDIAEVNGPPGGSLKAGGLTGFTIFNTDPSAPNLIDPDGNTAPSVTTIEVYNPNVSNPNVSNPNVSNPNVSNPNVSNPNVSNPNVSNPNVSNPNVSNADLANPNVSNPNVSNPNVSNPNVSNPNVSNPNVSNEPVSDATYTVTNDGNTASTYRVQLAGSASGTPLQVILSKPYGAPASENCVLFEQQHNFPISSIVNPSFVNAGSPPDPGITDSSEGNATFVLGPKESILVTIRAPVDVQTLANIVNNVAPVVVAHAPNTNDPTNKPATSPPVITTSALPDGVAGQPYTAAVAARGGRPPYSSWTATGLPAGLSISGASGLISGVPGAVGTFSVGLSVTDSAPKTGSRTLSLRIANPLVITTAFLPNVLVGVAHSQPLASSGGIGTRTWSVVAGSLPPGLGLSTAGVLSGTPTTAGAYPFTVQVVDSAAPAQTAIRALSLTIDNPCGTAALVASISAANGTTQTINLLASCTYSFVSGSVGDPPTALPHITAGTNLTINGNGAIIERATGATPAFRLFAVDAGATLTLNNVTLRNGGCSGAPTCPNLEGGAVYNGGTLNVALSTFSANNAGGDFTESRGGAIETFGALSVDQSTFSGNSAQNNGGAIFNWGGALSVTNSTFANNHARNAGGAIVTFSPSSSTITNSTFAGNTADLVLWSVLYDFTYSGSAIYNQSYAAWIDGGDPSGPLTVTSSTFSGNGANGAVTTEAIPFLLRNSILSGSAGANCALLTSANDGGYNISSDASCGFLPTTGSLNSTDPLLDPAGLSSAGGPTQVVVPLPGSPAVDAIPGEANGCGTSLTTDQRGAARPTGPGCDIGAVEFPPVIWGWATLSNIKLNGGTNVLTLPGGGAFTISHDYTVANDPLYCPGCIDQIEIGLAVSPPVCVYNGIPYPPQSGTVSTSLTAPPAPGVYYIGMDWALNWGCFEPITPGVPVPPYWNSGPPTPNRYIGKVIVPSP